MERSVVTPEPVIPASSTGAPPTPPSEKPNPAQPLTAIFGVSSPSASAKKTEGEEKKTPLQAISHGILMDGKEIIRSKYVVSF